MKHNNPYCRRTGDVIRIGNGILELGFDAGRNGALISIRDSRSGYEFQRDPDVPRLLFRLGLRTGPRRAERWFDSAAAGTFEWEATQDGAAASVQLTLSGFPGRPLTVQVSVRVDAGSNLSAWRMRVAGLRSDETVWQLTCPVISGVMQPGAAVPGECVATPRQSEGYLFRDPYPVVDDLPLKAGGLGPESPGVGMGELHATYPGSLALQLLLYYNAQAGLYLACHDSGEHVKTFDLGQMGDWGLYPVMSISHLPPESMGGEAAFDYDTMVGVFHGDWYDGADIYKAWARQQWWCEKKLEERDIAGWLRTGIGVWQMSNFHIPRLKLNHSLDRIAEEVNGLAREIGVPLAALVFNFEGGGAWTGPKGFFPPREGEAAFVAAMKKLRDAGNHGFIYMPGGNWYIAIDSYRPPFDSWAQFEAEGRANSIVDARGEVRIAQWYAGWHSTVLCPQTPCVRDLTASLLLGALERGCTIVQIDNFPCGGAVACYEPGHGHPLGHGPWYARAWGRILRDVRHEAKALNPDCAISTEGISENYIPHLDLFDQRAGNMEYFGHWSPADPMGGETIPMFSYVYSGYIGAYLAAYPECNRPEVLYWTRSLGKALNQGVIPSAGRYFPEPAASNPVTLAFYKKIIRATARECWRYIMFGEMLRPPQIDVPWITASYLKIEAGLDHLDPNARHEVRDHAVQHSAWRATDGTIGYFFVNISREPVAFDVDLSAYGSQSGAFDVDAVVDGCRTCLRRRTRLPARQRIEMAPLSITVLEVSPGGNAARSARPGSAAAVGDEEVPS